MDESGLSQQKAKTATEGAEAGGVKKDDKSESRWFVAEVKNNTELSVSKKLEKDGFDTLVLRQRVLVDDETMHRKVWKNVFVMRGRVLVYCSEKERLEVIKCPNIRRFMVDRTSCERNSNRHPIVVLSQEEVDVMKILLNQADQRVELSDKIVKGVKVYVTKGVLKGYTGEVDTLNKARTRIRINILGQYTLSVFIDRGDVEVVG